MRIVSLSPAATEWLAAFGADDLLVGRSHACDTPPAVPVLTRPTPPEAGAEPPLQATLRHGLSRYEVDLDRLRELRPDLVVTQAPWDANDAALDDLARALSDWTESPTDLFAMRPTSFKQVLEEAMQLARRVGRLPQAMRAIGDGELRLQRLRARLGAHRDGSVRGQPPPTVAIAEQIEPLVMAGRWVPDLAHLAGGRAVLAEEGQPPRAVSWEDLVAADPEVLVIAVRGRSIEQALGDLHHLAERSEWTTLQAVRRGRVWVLDGNAYIHRPGPRLYRSVELLVAALHPQQAGVAAEPREMVRWAEDGEP